MIQLNQQKAFSFLDIAIKAVIMAKKINFLILMLSGKESGVSFDVSAKKWKDNWNYLKDQGNNHHYSAATPQTINLTGAILLYLQTLQEVPMVKGSTQSMLEATGISNVEYSAFIRGLDYPEVCNLPSEEGGYFPCAGAILSNWKINIYS